jgi:hypothetical protein
MHRCGGRAAGAGRGDPDSRSRAGARSSFVDGADWAYLTGIVAILLGAALVYFFYPRKDKEKQLLEEYFEEDTHQGANVTALENGRTT